MSLVVVEVVGVSGLVVGDSWLRSSPALLSPLACVGGVEQPGKLSLSPVSTLQSVQACQVFIIMSV